MDEQIHAQALNAKSRRCYHRVMSGIMRGGVLRFLTLTSSDQAPKDIQKSWHALKERMTRRGLLAGYIKVPEFTQKGKLHLHVLFRGSYIEQRLISEWWSQIHQSPVVDIRAVQLTNRPRKIASYMAKYMTKEMAGRYSWSWGWVWRGFVRDWTLYKRWYWKCVHMPDKHTFKNLIVGWDLWLQGVCVPDFDIMLEHLYYTIRGAQGVFFPLSKPIAIAGTGRLCITSEHQPGQDIELIKNSFYPPRKQEHIPACFNANLATSYARPFTPQPTLAGDN